MKEKILSVTDFKMQTFRSGGKGGQHQNTTNSGVRIIHLRSGATGESREERSQHQNRKIAFKRLIEGEIFQTWLKLQLAERFKSLKDIEFKIDREMESENIKIEYRKNGKWEE